MTSVRAESGSMGQVEIPATSSGAQTQRSREHFSIGWSRRGAKGSKPARPNPAKETKFA
jgi:fumarate hydratase class II